MIAPTEDTCEGVPELEERAPEFLVLARYGRVPQVARFAAWGDKPERTASVVVSTDRGQELAIVLQTLPTNAKTAEGEAATPTGEAASTCDSRRSGPQLQETSRPQKTVSLNGRSERRNGNSSLELIDIERTLDDRLILYVLNDRSAETTRTGPAGGGRRLWRNSCSARQRRRRRAGQWRRSAVHVARRKCRSTNSLRAVANSVPDFIEGETPGV